jgi:hypothetical protein
MTGPRAPPSAGTIKPHGASGPCARYKPSRFASYASTSARRRPPKSPITTRRTAIPMSPFCMARCGVYASIAMTSPPAGNSIAVSSANSARTAGRSTRNILRTKGPFDRGGPSWVSQSRRSPRRRRLAAVTSHTLGLPPIGRAGGGGGALRHA